MANVLPPGRYTGFPATITLPATTTLFRVHLKGYDAHEFNPNVSHRYYGGGRFDSTDDDAYPFLYAGETVDVAVSETLLRDLHPDDTGIRLLPRPKILGRRISAIELTADLELVTLRSGSDLGAVAQDTWLTTCDPGHYAQSRHWGHWVRAQTASTVAGYVWRSKREPMSDAFVFFGDRIQFGSIVEVPQHPSVPAGDRADFDTPRGRQDLRARLSRYNVALARR